MGRAWRIEYEGALYLILSRGNEQGDIFYDNTDRGRFLDIIGELSERFAVDIHNSRFDTFSFTVFNLVRSSFNASRFPA
jgi:hypothetical protein